MPDTRAIIFSGRIYPERTYVGLKADGPSDALLLSVAIGSGAPVPMRVVIDSSKVIVAMAAPDPSVDLSTLKSSVQPVVSSFADVIGWQNGCGYRAEVTSYASSDAQGVFGV